ncbi:16S rRNA (cytidine(1402)-2'-O)-methyltransferase [Cryobacterium sp. TMT2-18-3]|uniref:16S rRNA (cytidine(1402)-2'-O)-methyltransferase n=1 Tax=unclassified Cryobacterium TaxID=2649013 RepID=UPI00106A77EB|nr:MULTISPECIES: 16S rRNA (cytidine(1402)-2'-O)-methyltransferase [unclassified Cryobacterium]TFC31621.1 16S rRNA (cytidine(1402)-2'-O)-methyltransferase [Cryobacterium sp. TMT2-18-2]TFC33496.1 16S rRNA (cytidine(1402)-2'-O)-methyltransferase [Cryobacterium sp. TMT2-42-4]TFC67716.1 16S rRNA (cytidine(1402)-2'-O)-methyltransferase [Cryobacterium sp. TMT2-18-3]
MILLAATPIGNLGDASTRLIEALGTMTIIAAEDTRVTVHLLKALGIENRPRLISLHDHNERGKAAELVELARDTDILVLSDAGMPTVSDPGFHLVDAAVAAGVVVSVLPGPSAVLAALAVSGLPTDRFTFEGFLPRKHGDRVSALREVAAERRTMVFFESPNRLAASLTDLAAVLGAGRRVAVCRELTKFYEEVKRGTAIELADWAAGGVKGEIAIVVAGAEARVLDLETGVVEVLALVGSGIRLKDAAADVSAATGLGKRALYEAALERKTGKPAAARTDFQALPLP